MIYQSKWSFSPNDLSLNDFSPNDLPVQMIFQSKWSQSKWYQSKWFPSPNDPSPIDPSPINPSLNDSGPRHTLIQALGIFRLCWNRNLWLICHRILNKDKSFDNVFVLLQSDKCDWQEWQEDGRQGEEEEKQGGPWAFLWVLPPSSDPAAAIHQHTNYKSIRQMHRITIGTKPYLVCGEYTYGGISRDSKNG